jgi:DNA-binding PadR family transcriptional regulator
VSLRHAVLAALVSGEASGYDLAKAFRASVGNFWVATPQQLYRELERLDEDGQIAGRMVEQERRPNKRVYSLTHAGYATLAQYTREPTRDTTIKDPLLVKVQAVDVGDVAAVVEALRQRIDTSRRKLHGYEALRERLLGGATEPEYLATAPAVGPYLTLLRGLRFERENIDWAQQALAVLEARLPGEQARSGPTAG